MSVTFTYGDVSSEPSSVTRTVSVATDPELLPGFFTAFQLSLAFDASAVEILDWSIAASDPQAIKATNPATPEIASETGSFRLSGVSLTSIAPGTPFLTLTYRHAPALDPVFRFSNIIIDETRALASAVPSTYANANPETNETVVVDDVAETLAIVSVIDSDAGLNLYGLADGRIAFSTLSASAGDSLRADALVILKLSTNIPVDINAILASGLIRVDMQTNSDSAVIDLAFSDGMESTLTFSRVSGLLLDSSSTTSEPEAPTDPGSPSVDLTAPDGVNLGSGATDAVGVEVLASEVANFFSAPSDAIVVYRQRLGDAVAFEALNPDSSVVGKFFGDSASRTVATIKTGSLDFVLDAPAGVNLDILGLSGTQSASRAMTYLNGLVDAALGNDSAVASWANSIKIAVAKMSQAHLGENVDLKVFTPTRTASGTDEISIGAQSNNANTAAINLAVINDLVTATGFDSLVVVGDGRLKTSGSASANVFGDSFSQEIIGGSGDDFLSGGGGRDVLTGGAGRDTFELGFAGTTVLADLAPQDTLKFSIFGVSSMEQLAMRLVSVGPSPQGLLVQFDGFAVELVGYNDLGQFASEIIFA
jgi:Ca2+-binding RTX toxin-like protein